MVGNASLGRMVIEVSANMARLQSDMQRASTTVVSQMERMRSDVNSKLTSIENQARVTGQAILASFGAIGSIEITKRLSAVADEYANIQAKIKLVARETGAAAAANERVFQIAQRTFTSYDGIATVVGRSTRAIMGLGVANRDALNLSFKLSETISKGLALSGATTNEAQSSILQLSQALAAGKLAGDEFRSFMENAPRLAQGLADSLQVPIGTLREMSIEGKLTSQVLIAGLLDASTKIEQEWADVPLTIGRAWQQLTNQFVRFVGETSQATGAANVVARSIQLLGDNLSVVANLIASGVMLFLVRQLASAAQATIDYVARIQAQVAAQKALAAATAQELAMKAAVAAADIQVARAGVAASAAKQAELASTAALIDAVRAEEVSKLQSVQADIRKAQAGIAAAEAAGAQSFALRVLAEETARLTALQQVQAGVLTELAALGTRAAAVTAAQARADDVLTAAQARLTAAQAAGATAATAAAAATATASTAMGVAGAAVGRLGAGLLALVGGPIGATIIALGLLGYAMYELSNSTTDAEKSVDTLISKYEDMAQRARDASQTPMELINKEQANVELQLLDQIAEKRDLLARQQTIDPMGDRALMAFKNQAADTQEEIARLEEKLERLRTASADAAVATMQHNEYMERQKASLSEVVSGMTAAAGSTEANAGATEKMASALESAEKFQDRYNKKYADWLKRSKEGYQALMRNLDPMEALNQEYSEGLAVIEEYAAAHFREKDVTEQVAKAVELLNKQYDAKKKAIEAQMAPHQELLRDMDREIVLLGMSAEAREVEAQLYRVSEGLSADQVNALRSEIAARQSVIDSMERQRAAVEDFQATVSEGFYALADVIGSALSGSIDSMEDFGRSLADIARRTVAEIISQFIKLQFIQPLLSSIFGGGSGATASVMSSFFGGGGSAGGIANLFTSGGSGGFGGAISSLFGGGGFAGLGGAPAGGMSGVGGFGAGGTSQAGWGINSAYGAGPGSALGGFGTAVAGIAGGLYGWNAYGGRNTTGARVGSTLAYGAGGIALAGTAAGLAGGASLGAAAGGAFGALGSSAAIPVVGWILAAAALVDAISGGKLFGTSFRPESSSTSIGISEGGALADVSLREVRNRSLFRGRQWRNSDLEVPDDLRRAADDFYNGVLKTMTSTARRLDTQVPAMVDAIFTTKQEYDKKGKPKGDPVTSATIAGRTYSGITFEEFQKRSTAEAMIAVVDEALGGVRTGIEESLGTIGGPDGPVGPLKENVTALMKDIEATYGEASRIAERWRGDADALLAGAEFLVAAVEAMQNGVELLNGGSLTQVTDIVEELQADGESMVQTFQRLVQQTEMLREAMDLMSVDLGKSEEDFVRFADAISQSVGGLQEAERLWTSFFTNYFDQTELAVRQAQQAKERMDEILGEVGLTSGVGLSDARARFEELLPTLSAEEVANWLIALDVLAQYNIGLAEATANYEALMAQFRRGSLSEFQQTLVDIANSEAQAVADANRLAIAMGRSGASTRDLAAIHNWAAQQAARALQVLKTSTQDLISRLYGGTPGTVDEVNRRIQALEQALQDSVNSQNDGIDAINQANADRYRRELAAIEQISDFLDSLVLSNLSTFNPFERLIEARAQYESTLAAAQGGDIEAMEALTGVAQTFLTEAQSFYGPGEDYVNIFNMVRAALAGFVRLGPQTDPGNGSGGGGGGTGTNAELEALYRQRDEMMAAMEAQQRMELATMLAQQLGDLANALNTPVVELAMAMGVNLQALVSDLGVNLDELTASTTMQLAGIAEMLGITLPELAAAVGVPMTELVAAMGINLGELSAATIESLTNLAGELGITLSDLADSVGIDLGELANAQSLLNDALEAVIAGLPSEQAAEMAPLLAAIEEATTEADANAAIEEMTDYIAALSPDLQALFSPFFAGLGNLDNSGQLWYLQSIAEGTGTVAGAIAEGNLILAEILAAVAPAPEPIDQPPPPPDGSSATYYGSMDLGADESAQQVQNVYDMHNAEVSKAIANLEKAVRESARSNADRVENALRSSKRGT